MSELLGKSFLFEIVDKKTNKIDKSFTLIIPPQMYSIKEAQRVAITKTFRNMHVDDYGADNLEITIKGYSGTAHVFPTFSTKGISYPTPLALSAEATNSISSTGLDQRSAFYTFRDNIMRYKDRDGWDKKELRVYDLYDAQAYKCILLNFSLDRTSNNPLRYPYTIQLMVYERLDHKYDLSKRKIDIAEDPFNALNLIDDALDELESKYRLVTDVVNQIASAKNQIQLVRARLNTFLSQTRQVVEAPLTIIKQSFDIMLTGQQMIHDAYVQGKTTYDDYAHSNEIANTAIRKILALYGYSITQGSQSSKNVTVDTGVDMEITTDGATNVVSPDTYTFTGFNTYIVKGADTLQSIALDQLGDTTLWVYIASVNDILDNSELVVGSTIYIPVKSDSTLSSKDLFVMSEDATRDPYGSDIMVDSDGNIVVQENSDLSVIGGVENVIQSVNLRLATEVGSVVTQTVYGLLGGIGTAGTTLAINYIKMNIVASLLQDSRIESVDNVKVLLHESEIRVSMDIGIIGYDQTVPVTAVL